MVNSLIYKRNESDLNEMGLIGGFVTFYRSTPSTPSTPSRFP